MKLITLKEKTTKKKSTFKDLTPGAAERGKGIATIQGAPTFPM